MTLEERILTSGSNERWRRLWWMRRMEPNWRYYVVFGAAGGALGAAVDSFTGVPWWSVTLAGLLVAAVVPWLTVLDDVRTPLRSLRILLADLDDPHRAGAVRARAYDVPLFAPPMAWDGQRRVRGGGSRGRRLFSPVLPTVCVEWRHGEQRVEVCTVAIRPDEPSTGRFPAGLRRGLSRLEDQVGDEQVDFERLAGRVRPFAVRLGDREAVGSSLNFSAWGRGWIAEVALSDGLRLEISVQGLEPRDLELHRLHVHRDLELGDHL